MSTATMGARASGSFLTTLLVTVMLLQSASANTKVFTWQFPKNTDVPATCSGAGGTTTYNYKVSLVLGSTPVEPTCVTPPGQYAIGAYTIKCSGNATDSAGIEKSASDGFKFTVTDKDPPTLTIKSPLITISATGKLTNFDVASNLATSDNCSPTVTVKCTSSGGFQVFTNRHTAFPLGHYTITCTATDGYNNTSPPGSYNVDCRDKTAPVLPKELLDLTTITREATSPAGAPVPVPEAAALMPATDAVDGPVAISCTSSLPGGALPAIYPIGPTSPTTTVVVCSATDKAGNKASHTINVNIVDTTAPAITPPADKLIEAKSLDGEIVNYEYVVADIVDPAPAITSTPASGSKFPFGVTTTVTITAKDKYGNTNTKTFKVTVKDTTAPAMPSLPNPYEIPLDNPTTGTLPAFPNATDVVYGVVPLVCNPLPGTPIPITGTTVIVKCTATDGSGNVASKDYPVIVVRPASVLTLVVPGNKVLDAVPGFGGAPYSFTPTASDNLTNPQIVITCTNTNTTTPIDFTKENPYPFGVTTVACTATNRVGRTDGPKSFTVTVVDRTAPFIKGTSATVPAKAVLTFVDYFNTQLTWSDDISAVELLRTNTVCTGAPADSKFPLGSTSITCTTKDAAGNPSAPTTFTVIVEDKIAPTCEAIDIHDVSLTDADSIKNGLQLTYPLPTCTDNIDGPVVPDCSPASQTRFPIRAQKYTITCTATDKSSNTKTYTYDFIVSDGSSPIVTVPNNVVIEATSPAGAKYTFSPAPSAATVIGTPLPVTCTRTSGDTFGPELLVAYPVTCTAINPANGKTASATFTVTVKDTTPPKIQDLPDVILTANDKNNSAPTKFPAPKATDTVDDNVEVTCTQAPDVDTIYNFASSPINVTCTAKDNSGNVAVDTFQIIVIRAPAPILQCPSSTERPIKLTKGKTTTVDYVITSSTNDPIICNPTSPVTVTLKELTTVTCKSTSVSGNVASCVFSYRGVDDTPPVIKVPADIVQNAKSPKGNTLSAADIKATATDDVDGDIVPVCNWPGKALAADGSALFPIGDTVITCTATDSSGNTATKSFKVTINKDNVPPVICTQVCVRRCANYGGTRSFTIKATASDNLDGFFTTDMINGTGARVFPFGKSEVILSVSDSSGNVATQKVTVEIVDCQVPMAYPPGTINVDGDGYGNGAIVNYPPCYGTDDVTPPAKLKWIYSKASGTRFPHGTTAVTCAAIDESGKYGYAKFNVYVRGKNDRCKRFTDKVAKSGCGLSHVVAKWCQKVHDKKEQEECECYKEVGYKLQDRRYKMSDNDRRELYAEFSSMPKPACQGGSSYRKSLL